MKLNEEYIQNNPDGGGFIEKTLKPGGKDKR